MFIYHCVFSHHLDVTVYLGQSVLSRHLDYVFSHHHDSLVSLVVILTYCVFSHHIDVIRYLVILMSLFT